LLFCFGSYYYLALGFFFAFALFYFAFVSRIGIKLDLSVVYANYPWISMNTYGIACVYTCVYTSYAYIQHMYDNNDGADENKNKNRKLAKNKTRRLKQQK